MKKLKRIRIYLIVIIILLLLFTNLMCIAYMLPDEKIRENIEVSLNQIKKEGQYPIVGYRDVVQEEDAERMEKIATLDNYTDCLMLSIALNNVSEEESLLERAVENSYYKEEPTNIIKSLTESLQDKNLYTNRNYDRYWFGIVCIIRPLLLFFNYAQIRYIIMVFLFILLGIMATLMSKQLNNRYVVAIFIAIAMMNMTSIQLSIQFSSVVCIAILSVIATLIVYQKKKIQIIPIAMFVTGALASFLDLLTYPLITLGLPMIVIVLLENKRQEKTIKQTIEMILKYSVLWVLGYGMAFLRKMDIGIHYYAGKYDKASNRENSA